MQGDDFGERTILPQPKEIVHKQDNNSYSYAVGAIGQPEVGTSNFAVSMDGVQELKNQRSSRKSHPMRLTQSR